MVFLSGDIHYAELSRLDVNVPYTLWDLTSSGLTEEWRVPTPNANRASESWPTRTSAHRRRLEGRGDKLTLGIVDTTGRTRMTRDIELASLTA